MTFSVFSPWTCVGQPDNHIGWATLMPFSSVYCANSRTNPWNFCEKKMIIGTQQIMTEALFLTLGQSRRYDIWRFCLRNSFISPNSEVECIKYNLIDFCDCLLVTSNFSFENNRVLHCCNYFLNSKRKPFQNFYGQLMEKNKLIQTFGLCRWKFSVIKLGGWSLSRRLKKSGFGQRLR